MTCAQCGAANGDGARFCGVCGAAVSFTEPVSNPSLGQSPPELAMIGREIAGRYRMLAKLGEGGMGAVFRAEQISLKRTVAVKLLRPDVVGSQMLLRRFNAEAEAVAKLSHPNTVNIYDFGQDSDGTLFIAMEYIEGRSLRQVIHHEAPLPPRRALAIAQQVAASLADAHARSIVHRDLKPDNVMLQDRGRERDIARVLDFGIAKLRDDTRATQMQMTQQGDMLGTPQYMAPEQIRAGAIDGRTDIYALGCLLYEMVTGRLPHEAPTVLALLSKHLLEHPVPPSQRRPELGLPVELDALILGAMAKDPGARPPTMEAFGEQIAALYATQSPDPRSAQRSAAVPVPVTAVPHPSTGGGPYAGTPAPGALGMNTPAASSEPYFPPAGGAVGRPVAPPHQPPPYQPPPHQPPPGANTAGVSANAPGVVGPPLPSRRPVVIALAGIALVGAAVTGLVFAMRSHTPAAKSPRSDAAKHDEPEHDEHDEHDEPDEHDEHDEHDGHDGHDGHDEHDPPVTPPASDPWAGAANPSTDPWARAANPSADPWAGSHSLDGDKVAIGQGVEVIIPPGFRTTVRNGVTIALDDNGTMIAAGPIAIATNDPQKLARYHAKANGLVFESMQQVPIAGAQRAMASFHGKVGGVMVRHIAMPLIGSGYRVFVAFQAPAQRLASDQAVQALVVELFSHRIVLP